MDPDSPDLDAWLPDPAVRISHRRESSAPADRLWAAARGIRLSDTRLLGRLVRWRIPGVAARTTFDELFRNPPFAVLEEGERMLVSGLVGRIWTLRRDYPMLEDPEAFRAWSQNGTARVLFANWVVQTSADSAAVRSETRIDTFGAQGRVGMTTVRPLIRGFQQLVSTDAMAAVVRRAERD